MEFYPSLYPVSHLQPQGRTQERLIFLQETLVPRDGLEPPYPDYKTSVIAFIRTGQNLVPPGGNAPPILACHASSMLFT